MAGSPHFPMQTLAVAILAAAGAGWLAAAPPASEPGSAAPSAAAGGSGEAAAGGCCRGGLFPVCRRVATTRTKLETEYEMTCTPVCVPGCGLLARCGGACGCTTATVRQQKRLLKKVTEKQVASYEYKIVWVCRACAFGGCCRRPPAASR